MKNKTYIYALGIYKGGGLQVLKEFIKLNKNCFYYFDSRLNREHIKGIKNFKLVKQNLRNIILKNFELKKENINIFLPPLLSLSGNTFVMYQNLNIFPPTKFINLILWLFSSDFLRFMVFKLGYKNVQKWFVLSDIAYKALSIKLNNVKNIKKVLFFDILKIKKKINIKKKYDFIYPADLKRHKNHKNIILALLELSKENIKPSFLFTFTEYEKEKINFAKLQKHLNIHNFKYSDNRINFFRKLRECKCLFFPSEHETIGLPIIEAYNNNLLIATSDEKYAKQFIEPNIVFDQNSVVSIKKTIKHIYLKKKIIMKRSKVKNFHSFLKKEQLLGFINEQNNYFF